MMLLQIENTEKKDDARFSSAQGSFLDFTKTIRVATYLSSS